MRENYKDRFHSFGEELRETIVGLLIVAIWAVVFIFLPFILEHFFPGQILDNHAYSSYNRPVEYDWLGRER